MVSIPLNDIILGETGTGTKEDPLSIRRNQNSTYVNKPSISVVSGTEGYSGYYTSDVIVRMSASNCSQIKYKINNGSWQTISGTSGTYTVTTEGETTITAYAVDSKGNRSEEEIFKVKKDSIAPNKPSITVTSGTLGNNNYYKTNVIVTIRRGTDANRIFYKINNGELIDINDVSMTYTITSDGETTITAYATDEAGNISSPGILTIKKDATVPSTASLSVSSYDKTTISVNASGADSTSGVYKYSFYKKTSSETNYSYVGERITSSGTCQYTYEELTEGATYNLYVIVTDRAGKTRTSGVITQSTKSQQAGSQVDKPSGWTSDKVTAIEDGNGGKVPLPDGYYYVGGNINTGLVISDKPGDTLNSSGTSSGNQFVWIPVPNSSYLTRTEFNIDGQPTNTLDSDCIEPNASGYPGEVSEYNTMRTQVLKYGGFYIGRYEAGVNSTTLRTKETTAQTVVSKKGVAPYNYVKWGESMTNIGTTGAVYLAKNKYSHPDSVTSTLTYGCQWDAMCRYIEDSQRTTPKKSAPELTGSVSSDVSKNIYDLAGNCEEWIMESWTDFARFSRGGNFEVYLPVSSRTSYIPNGTSRMDIAAFRIALHIK